MPPRKRNELKAGILVLIGLATMLGLAIWLGAAELFRASHQQAVFYLEEVALNSGLEPGSEVLINDDRIGTVTRIRYDPRAERTYYTVNIHRRDVPLYADARATVYTDFLGNAYVVVSDRGEQQDALASAEHPVELEVAGMIKAARTLGDAGEALQEMGAAVMERLEENGFDEILQRLQNIVTNADQAAEDIAAITAGIRPQMDPEDTDSLLARAHMAIADLQEMAAQLRGLTDPTLDGSLAALSQATLGATSRTAARIEEYVETDVARLLAGLHESNARIQAAAESFAGTGRAAHEMIALNQPTVERIIDDLSDVSSAMRTTMEEIRRAPWLLLRRPRDADEDARQIHQAARDFATGAARLDRALARLRALAEVHEVLDPADPNVQRIRQELMESFQHFRQVERALWERLAQ